MLEVQDRGIEDRELLLDADREIGGRLEFLANRLEVKAVVLWLRIGCLRRGL
jgi:hypothetical protein